MFNNIFGNWRTTLLGAIVGAMLYLQSSGVSFPQTSAEWKALLVSLAVAAWGAIQKDGSTGSKAV